MSEYSGRSNLRNRPEFLNVAKFLRCGVDSVLYFFRYTPILVPADLEEAGILELLKLDSFAPQLAGFLACLCSTGNSDERLLVLCCYPLHMANKVWKAVSSRYNVGRHGQDTSRHPLNREDKVFFSLPDALSPCEQIDMETNYLL